MQIRKSIMDDYQRLEEIYAFAREQMKKNGNPNQWGDNKPGRETIQRHIRENHSYVLAEGDDICGTFVFFTGDDPTYHVIKDGKWKNDDPYGVIHCVASDGTRKGLLMQLISYCEEELKKQGVKNLRIDTHECNHIMQHLLTKEGFEKCGIIYTDDGTERIAFQKVFDC